MKKPVIILIFIMYVFPGFGQKTTYDLANFTPPKGWKKIVNDGVVMYNSPENKTGSFCLISIYKSIDGSGDLSTDFNNAWTDLVANRLGVKDQPAIEKSEPENGWDSESGSASFTRQGSASMAVLTTMSGYNKLMSILVITNDQAYIKELDGFYNSVSLQKLAAVQKSKSSTQIVSATGVLGDYVFTPPPGWTKEVSANEIVLRGPDKVSVLSILPMQASTGDLEKDMSSIFWQVFPGWRPDEWNPDHHVLTKGVAPAGWSYLKEEMAIAKTEGDKNYKAYGFVMLAQLNGQVAIIAGSYIDATNVLEESMHVDWLLFFHSLAFKNYKSNTISSLSKDVLGQWITGSSSGLVTYTFAANGRYSNGSAFSTSRDISAYKILETTTSFVGDGKYSIKGNELTLTATRTNITRTSKVRVFYQKQYGDWQKRIGMLEKSIVNGKLYEITMAWQDK